MEFLPLYHKLQGEQCVIVGGGETAYRKATLLVRSGAVVTIVAPRISDTLQQLIDSSGGQLQQREFIDSDLDSATLVIAATDDQSLNARVAAGARTRYIPVNVVDQPELCSFIFPAIVDRSPVIVSISSSGTSPVLARMLKTRLEMQFPSAVGRLAELLGRLRGHVKQKFPTIDQRRKFWETVVDSPAAEIFLAGKEEEGQRLIEDYVNKAQPEIEPGEVYLVGAGPGDPDLLTLRALRLMQKADIVLYDNLVSPEILQRVRQDARREYVGKRRSLHSISQEALNDKLVRLAQEGNRVLRLKGGDPFIFGRGGEEIEKLASHHIPFQVVPGITAASGCACYAGIPLTHRDYSQSVRFVTGHPSAENKSLQWHEFVHNNQTIVFYMGLAGLDEICRQLIAHGRSPDTPIALISKGTTPQQQVFTATLDTMPQLIAEADVHAPTLIIVGEVVELHATLGLSASTSHN